MLVRSLVALAGAAVLVLSASCTDQVVATAPPPAPTDDAGQSADTDASSADAAPADAGPGASFTGKCADAFGDALTAGFGRIDGLVYSVQRPTDVDCTFPNRDHLILQVWMNAKVYRMVINVESDRAGQDPKVRFAALPHALVGPAFAEGWHADAQLDYPSSLGAKLGDFAPMAMNDLVEAVAKELVIGAPVSVYAVSGPGRPESAHLVHRNPAGLNEDGAVVVNPASATPRFFLFHFDGQTF